jgi:GDSL-like lipase/acylhydrolase family protein
LATVCREGSSLTLVGIVLALYVLAAALWVHGQHKASVDAVTKGDDSLRPLTPRYGWSVLAVLGGVLAAGYGVWRDNGSALICGVLVAYLFAGYLLMRARMYESGGGRKRIVAGKVVLVGVTVVVVVGLLLFEESGWFVIPVGFIAFAPIGLSLLAEPKIRRLQELGGTELDRSFCWGAAVLLLAVVIAYLRVGTLWIWPAFLALTLLVLAIVSNTQADIAVVIAAVSLMGLTPGSDDKPDKLTPKPADANVLVALGDSYMSGEGEDVYFKEKDDDEHENHCHRAPTAWAVKAVTEKGLFDSVAFLACSGARTFHVRHKIPTKPKPTPTPQYNEPDTQLDQAHALGLEPSLVVVSLGGNDAGFSTIGMMCMAPGDCSEEEEMWVDNLPNVAGALSLTYDQIRAEFPDAPVLVVGYPAPIHIEKGESCDDVALSERDMGFVNDFVIKLNDKVEETAKSKGFYFLDMEPALAAEHLQLCDPDNSGRPGLNFIGLRSVGGFAEQRFNPGNWYHNSLHPNRDGHAAMLKVFEHWRTAHKNPATTAPKEGESVPAGKPPNPPCDLWETDESDRSQCDDEGAAWVRGQIRNAMLFWGLWGVQIAIATAAAWLLAVAWLAWWKPWWPDPPG